MADAVASRTTAIFHRVSGDMPVRKYSKGIAAKRISRHESTRIGYFFCLDSAMIAPEMSHFATINRPSTADALPNRRPPKPTPSQTDARSLLPHLTH